MTLLDCSTLEDTSGR